MFRFALAMTFALGAGANARIAPTTAIPATRSVVADDSLHGRWAITAVNGRPVEGLWLELGERPPFESSLDGGQVAQQQPIARAHLGCNEWYPDGWARNGDKLTFVTGMAGKTERGCEPASMALEDEAFAILNKPMTMETTAPDRLRLINENGTLELLRDAN